MINLQEKFPISNEYTDPGVDENLKDFIKQNKYIIIVAALCLLLGGILQVCNLASYISSLLYVSGITIILCLLRMLQFRRRKRK
jgi:hypothetical protein